MSFPSPAELHLLYVLTDSALPTGGFVASSGLESYAKHGFLASSPSFSTNLGPPSVTRGVTDFARAEVENFASTSIGFVVHSFRLVSDFLDDAEHSNDNTSEPKDEEGASGVEVEDVIEKLVRLDGYHEATLLSHVARRSSKSQGVALLTLYTRGLGPPPGCESPAGEQGREGVERRARVMVDGYKRLIRSGVAPGHLAVCWGVITAALGLSLGE